MPEPLTDVLILLAGFSLGIVFYGGLWATIRALPTARHPSLLALGSFWGRTALVVSVLVVVVASRWQNAIVCMAGFLLARIVLGHLIPHTTTRRGAV